MIYLCINKYHIYNIEGETMVGILTVPTRM